MNNREQFEAWCESTNPHYKKTDDSVIDRAAWKIWHACAESKQAEIDKANARIAQLEKTINDNPPTIWLAEHDKAVEVKVLTAANKKFDERTTESYSLIFAEMIESRK